MTEDCQIKLIEAVLAGDIDSFGQLSERYYPALVAIGYSVLADHSLAEDAAQEALARALVSIKQLKNKDKFAPWLAAICRNAAIDMAADRPKLADIEDCSPPAHSQNDNDHSELVSRAMSRLSAGERELIVLRYYNDLSYQQIGSILGLSNPTINGRLARTKRKLAKYLKQNGFSGDSL